MNLYAELIAAGLPISEATEDGAISGLPGVVMTDEQKEMFEEIIRDHFELPEPMPSTEERIAAMEDTVLAMLLGG